MEGLYWLAVQAEDAGKLMPVWYVPYRILLLGKTPAGCTKAVS